MDADGEENGGGGERCRPEVGGPGRVKIGVWTATAIVVGNMVGTGVFTSLGFQVGGLPSGFVLMVLWGLGGVLAFCGATSYAELSAAMPRSGGEYHLLGRVFHPMAGFLAGWVSVTAAFAAPIGVAAMAFGKYSEGFFPGVDARVPAGVMLLVVTAVHLIGVRAGGAMQVVFTTLKVVLLAVLALAGLSFGESQGVAFFLPEEGDLGLVTSGAFAISLVYVMYAYTGWNAATYVVDDIHDPRRNVPVALMAGTAAVTLLYVLGNAGFLMAAPVSAYDGEVEVGKIAAEGLWGAGVGKWVGGLVGLGLVSSVSAMTWAGSRVACAVGEDYRALRWLALKTRSGVPWSGVLWQGAVALVLLVWGTFEAVVVAVEVVLLVSSSATVAGVFWLRWKRPDLERPCRAWGYPVTPLLFLGVSGWMIVHAAGSKPVETLWGVGLLCLGVVLYAAVGSGRRRVSGS